MTRLRCRRAGVPLSEVGQRFRDVDAVANAWFRRARLAMFEVPADELKGLTADERLARVLERWLDTLAAHRRVTGEMLGAKLYPSHPHHWLPMIFDLSRLVQDPLDAARVEGHGRVRQAQESGLTLVVLATLRDWLQDASSGQQRSKARLRRMLHRGGQMLACLGRAGVRGYRRPDAERRMTDGGAQGAGCAAGTAVPRDTA